MFNPELDSIVFLAAIIVIACAILGGLCLLCPDTQPDEEKPPKKLQMSDFK